MCRVAFGVDPARAEVADRVPAGSLPGRFGVACAVSDLRGRFLGAEYVFRLSCGEGMLGKEEVTPLEAFDGAAEFVRENCPKGIGFIRWA